MVFCTVISSEIGSDVELTVRAIYRILTEKIILLVLNGVDLVSNLVQESGCVDLVVSGHSTRNLDLKRDCLYKLFRLSGRKFHQLIPFRFLTSAKRQSMWAKNRLRARGYRIAVFNSSEEDLHPFFLFFSKRILDMTYQTFEQQLNDFFEKWSASWPKRPLKNGL